MPGGEQPRGGSASAAPLQPGSASASMPWSSPLRPEVVQGRGNVRVPGGEGRPGDRQRFAQERLGLGELVLLPQEDPEVARGSWRCAGARRGGPRGLIASALRSSGSACSGLVLLPFRSVASQFPRLLAITQFPAGVLRVRSPALCGRAARPRRALFCSLQDAARLTRPEAMSECPAGRAARRISIASRKSGSASVSLFWDCRSPARLFRPVAMSGCPGRTAAPRISSDFRRFGSAAA